MHVFLLLRLQKCKLVGDCCEALAGVLSSESTRRRELDLSANDLQEAGVKALCMGLCSQLCKLETLRLSLFLAYSHLFYFIIPLNTEEKSNFLMHF